MSNSNAATISEYTKADAKPIFDIEMAANPFPWTEKTFLSCIGGRYHCRQLRVNDKPVGFYVGELVVDEMTLMEICVHPEHQGNGYGQLLLGDFIQLAKSKQCNVCHLEVRSKNIAAQMLYMNNGFIQVGKRTGYYPAKVGYEDALLMSLTL